MKVHKKWQKFRYYWVLKLLDNFDSPCRESIEYQERRIVHLLVNCIFVMKRSLETFIFEINQDDKNSLQKFDPTYTP